MIAYYNTIIAFYSVFHELLVQMLSFQDSFIPQNKRVVVEDSSLLADLPERKVIVNCAHSKMDFIISNLTNYKTANPGMQESVK